MFPYWLRAFIFALLLFLIVNLFINFPKMEPVEDKNPKVVLLNFNETYKCEVSSLNRTSCRITCYLLTTGTRVVLKPEKCEEINNLKKGQIIEFKPLRGLYYSDGSISARLFSK